MGIIWDSWTHRSNNTIDALGEVRLGKVDQIVESTLLCYTAIWLLFIFAENTAVINHNEI